MTRNCNTQHPFVTLAEPVYHVAGGWWAVGWWVGGWWLGGWFVCVVCVFVCGLRFVVRSRRVGGWCGGGGWWLCLWLVCVLCVSILFCT